MVNILQQNTQNSIKPIMPKNPPCKEYASLCEREFFFPTSYNYIALKNAPHIVEEIDSQTLISLQHRSEFIHIDQHPPLILIFADLPGDHLHTLTGADRHADAQTCFARVGQQCGDHGIS